MWDAGEVVWEDGQAAYPLQGSGVGLYHISKAGSDFSESLPCLFYPSQSLFTLF